jgi:hypothetical protein
MIWRKFAPEGARLPELDFQTATIDDVLAAYFANGCVLLRNFVPRARLLQLQNTLDQILDETEQVHFYDREMAGRGLPHFYEYVFEDKHRALLNEISPDEYRIGDTATRRIDAAGAASGWHLPLPPHLDVFTHAFPFAVNFRVPFQDCGRDAPSLGVVRAPFAEAQAFTGYDGNPEAGGGVPVLNFPNFANTRFDVDIDLAEVQAAFGNRVWTPEYRFGDAMMLSNLRYA